MMELAAGVAEAFALTRLLSSVLAGVKPTNATTFAAMSVLFAVVALTACLIPALYATRIDPLVASRFRSLSRVFCSSWKLSPGKDDSYRIGDARVGWNCREKENEPLGSSTGIEEPAQYKGKVLSGKLNWTKSLDRVVGRTPWSAWVPLDPLLPSEISPTLRASRRGVGCGPGGRTTIEFSDVQLFLGHYTSNSYFRKYLGLHTAHVELPA